SAPHIARLPDVPRLRGCDCVRPGFMVGMIEERPTEPPDNEVAFAGAVELAATKRLFEHLEHDSRNRVDSRAFLAARLMDVFIGDWDRHHDQWRWARFDSADVRWWRPIPRDRDQAFARLDGLLVWLTGFYWPQVIGFGDDYPSIWRLTFTGQVLDRRLLVDLEKPVWDSIARSLQARLTDSVIAAAVRRLPPEYYQKSGAALERALRRRRDHLAQMSDRYYALLAGVVEIHGTDDRDIAEIERLPGGRVSVRLSARAGGAPFYRRTFHRRETEEIRLYLHGGDDRLVVRGVDGSGPLIRVMGGRGRVRLPAAPRQRARESGRRVRDGRTDLPSRAHRRSPRRRASRRRVTSHARIGDRCAALLRVRERDTRHGLDRLLQGEATAVPRRARAGVSTLRGGEPLRGPRAQVRAYQPRAQQVNHSCAPVRRVRPGPGRRGGGLSRRHARPAAGRAPRGQLRSRRELLRQGARRVRPGRRGPCVSVRRNVRPLARRRRGRPVARVPEPRQHAVRGGGTRRRGYADLRASGVRILAMTAEWKGEVPTLELLNRMVAESLPLGIRSGPIEQSFQRDVYFDSADWTLRRRGVACRFRTRVDDRRILTLRTVGRWEGGAPLVLPQTFEADVAELEGEQALRGMSDPARRLRALIEPTLLMPRIAFETERRWRRTHARWFASGRYEVVYDAVTVRSRQL